MVDFLNREEALLLVVDVQERLVPAIHKDLYPRSLKNMHHDRGGRNAVCRSCLRSSNEGLGRRSRR
jgi:hypothetical protein